MGDERNEGDSVSVKVITPARYHRNSENERILRGYARKVGAQGGYNARDAEKALAFIAENPPKPDDERHWSFEVQIAKSLIEQFRKSTKPGVAELVTQYGFDKPDIPAQETAPQPSAFRIVG